jgi:hypothetical protein
MPLINVSREKAPIVMGLAIVIILISLFSIMRTAKPGHKAGDISRLVGLGQVAGEETAKFLGPGKTVAVVRHGDEIKSPPLKKMQAAFIKALQDGSVSVTAEVGLEMDDSAPEVMMLDMVGLPLDEYIRIGEEYSSVDAIVSMVGGPYASEDELDEMPDSLPPLIISHGSDLRMSSGVLFDRGIVIMAIMPRFDLQEGADPQTDREWFDTYFQVVTPETAGDTMSY